MSQLGGNKERMKQLWKRLTDDPLIPVGAQLLPPCACAVAASARARSAPIAPLEQELHCWLVRLAPRDSQGSGRSRLC